jgi:hypothetical protein
MQEVKTAIEFQKDMFAAYEKFGQIAKTVDELNALVVEEVGKKWGKLEVAGGCPAFRWRLSGGSQTRFA